MKDKIKEILENSSELYDVIDELYGIQERNFYDVAKEISKLFDNSELVKDIKDRIKAIKILLKSKSVTPKSEVALLENQLEFLKTALTKLKL